MSSFRRPIKKSIIGLKFGHLVVTGFTDQRTRKKGSSIPVNVIAEI
jgi:hypothetical protein